MILDLYILSGWIGMALMISAYFMLALKKIKPSSISYNLLNLFGGIGVLVSAIYTRLWAVVVLNVFWSGVAVFSLYKKATTKTPYKEIK